MANVEFLTVSKYAEIRNIKPSAVINAMVRGHATPGLINWMKPGREYILYVDVDAAKAARKIPVKKRK